MQTFFKSTLCFLVTALALQAFPPAPYYTLYGLVRNQVGETLSAEGAVLILLKDDVEIGRTPIDSGLYVDKNYELKISMDANLSGSPAYSEQALPAQGLFSLVVEMNGSLFYPIEVSGNLTAGMGSERVQLDLNLGEDLDGDRLPDVWEQWQLYQAGLYPQNGNWPIDLITRDGDFDGDGSSNYTEYLAGTFAGDATERFELQIKEKTESSMRFEFYAITGKTYTIENSADMATWERVPFTVGAPGIGAISYSATSVGIRSAFTAPTSATTKEFYRLSVR
jgi:hypothetical protein